MGIRYVVMVQSSDQFNTVAIDVKATAKQMIKILAAIELICLKINI